VVIPWLLLPCDLQELGKIRRMLEYPRNWVIDSVASEDVFVDFTRKQ
jgi:hypothetical protein